MQARGFWTLSEVSDGELESGLRELLRAGGYTEARIVAHLAEVDTRRLHLQGAPSLFQYCLVDLGFSESEAWYRICAARTGRRFPLVFELLERRELHLTAVALLSKHLTEENHRELLTEARGRTKLQILENLARRWPKAAVASQLRRIPAGAVAAGPTATLEPRSAETYCLQLSMSLELKTKLEEARDLMSHANPSGDLAVVVERAVDVLIQKLRGRHFGQTSKKNNGDRRGETGGSKAATPARPAADVRAATPARPVAGVRAATPARPAANVRAATPARSAASARAASSGPGAGPANPTGEARAAIAGPGAAPQPRKRRHVRQDVRREVAERDAGRCRHVGLDGRRCDARAFLELHHELPWALGGPDSADNLQLLCRAHNRLRAELELGVGHVARAIERRRNQAGGAAERRRP